MLRKKSIGIIRIMEVLLSATILSAYIFFMDNIFTWNSGESLTAVLVHALTMMVLIFGALAPFELELERRKQSKKRK